MENTQFKRHAIQLVDIYPGKLLIEANVPPERDVGINIEDTDIQIGFSDIVEEDKITSLFVSVIVKTKEGKKELPFKMEVELRGLFTIDTEHFKKEHIEDWAHRGAMYVLLPYVREYIYWLTYRCNFKPLIMPLAQVPTIKYADSALKQKTKKAEPKKAKKREK